MTGPTIASCERRLSPRSRTDPVSAVADAGVRRGEILVPAIFPSSFRVVGVQSPAFLCSWLHLSPVMIHTRERHISRSLQASPFYPPFCRPERSRPGSSTPDTAATRFQAVWPPGFPASSSTSHSAPVPITSGHHARLRSQTISCRTSRSCQPRVPPDFQVAA